MTVFGSRITMGNDRIKLTVFCVYIFSEVNKMGIKGVTLCPRHMTPVLMA